MNNTASAAGQSCPAATSVSARLSKYVTAGLLAFAVFGTAPAFAKDPCKTALCMGGLLQGVNESECRQAIKDYFDIVVYKKKRKKIQIDWDATAKERLSFTNSCPGTQGFNKKVNDVFGKSSG